MRGIPVRGEKILELRKLRALSQEKLGSLADCDAKTVRKAEQSKHVDHSVVERLAAALEVPTEEIIRNDMIRQEQANIDHVFAWNNAFLDRDVERAASFYANEATVAVMFDERMPGGGEFSGSEGIRQWLSICFATFITERMPPEAYQVDAFDSLVFVRSNRPIKVTSVQSGQQTEAHGAHEFRIVDGKIVQHRIFPDTFALAQIIEHIEDDKGEND